MSGKPYKQHLESLSYSPTTILTHIRTIKAAKKYNSPSQYLDRGISPATRNKELAILKSYYDYLVEVGKLTTNPLAKQKQSRTPKRLPEALSPSVIVNIIESIDGEDFASLRDRAILEVGVSIGSRLSDFDGMLIEHLDIEHRLLKVTGKGSKEAYQPLGGAALQALERYLPAREAIATCDYLFVNSDGGPLKSVGYIFRKHLNGIRPHVFTRHSMAVAMLNNGENIANIKTWLRHDNLATTSVYLKMTQESVLQGHKRFHPRG